MRKWQWGLVSLLVLLSVSMYLMLPAQPAHSAVSTKPPQATTYTAQCLMCHQSTDAVTVFEDGTQRSVQFDIETFEDSKHGAGNSSADLACYDCHGSYSYPHNEVYQSERDFRMQLSAKCEKCHTTEAERQHDSTHATALDNGNENAAVCVDCHDYHNVQHPGETHTAISMTCGNCHTDIFSLYKDSVHGAALLQEGNDDVPTCIACHGVHNIENPTTNLFRLKSPTICAKCHEDEDLMAKYDISTYVFDSYVADFHGTTVTLFADQAPDAEVNKAVCYDCHGVHNIRKADKEGSRVLRENLLETCRSCHPDAEEGFEEAWLKHYEPDQDKFPYVYYVNLFYKIFIPSILGFFAIVLVPDAFRRIFRRDAGH